MKIFGLNKLSGVKLTTFPDSQPHIQVIDFNPPDEAMVVCSIDSPSKLLQLLELSNALEYMGAKKTCLSIPYLLCARSDRHMLEGDSFDLEVVATLINLCDFEEVLLCDVHSDIALKLIKNSKNIVPNLLEKYDKENPLYICPDKGAIGRVPENVEVIYCEKSRDLSTGKITLKVNTPEKAWGRNCIIIDDLCDGGGTFIAIAEQINPNYVTLAVTHGIFSKGLDVLFEYFDEIITTNSYASFDLQEKYKNLKMIRVS